MIHYVTAKSSVVFNRAGKTDQSGHISVVNMADKMA